MIVGSHSVIEQMSINVGSVFIYWVRVKKTNLIFVDYSFIDSIVMLTNIILSIMTFFQHFLPFVEPCFDGMIDVDEYYLYFVLFPTLSSIC